LDLAQGEQFDIGMPADLDQFGSKNSHRTIIGRERLIQLGHGTAYGRGAFHQVDIKPSLGKIQRRLHAGNTSADNHHRSLNPAIGLRRFHDVLPFELI
jgi:hypothetical protein